MFSLGLPNVPLDLLSYFGVCLLMQSLGLFWVQSPLGLLKKAPEFSGSEPWVCVRKVSFSCYAPRPPSQGIPGATWSSLCSTDRAAAAISGFHFSSSSRG